MKHYLRLLPLLVATIFPAVLAAQTLPNTSLSSGLMVWLQLDTPTGGTALDVSGSGKAGQSLTNSGGPATWQPIADRSQGSNQAVHLGTGNAIRIPLQWQPRTFSVAWWVKAASAADYNQAIGASITGQGNTWSGFLFHTDVAGRIFAGTTLATRLEVLQPGTFKLGTWQHFVFTFDNGVAALYQDGNKLATRPDMALPAAWQELSIGSAVSSTLTVDGDYDDFRVYDRALSASEVTQLRNSTAVVPTPPALPAANLDRNWVQSRSFDGNGNVVGEAKQFADVLGRGVQSQIKSQTTGHVFATQTVYSSGGKPVLSTLAAPTNNREFSYKEQFLTAGGTAYDASKFEGTSSAAPYVPAVADSTAPGTVGNYYSSQNTLEPQTAATSYPFSLTEEYQGPLGGLKRGSGPGNQFRMGALHEAKSRSFPLLNDLDHYLSLRPHFVAGVPPATSLYLKGEKDVSMDADGVESISFTDSDGQTLATCRSGPQYPGLMLTAVINANPENGGGLPQYQDLHIPAAGTVSLTVTGTGTFRRIDLQTDATTTYTAPCTIAQVPGFYRFFSESEGSTQTLSYLARYGEFSYSYYDAAGRVVATVAPKGVTLNGSGPESDLGQVGRWSFNEAAGTSAADGSRSGLAGTLLNQPTWSTLYGSSGLLCGLQSEYQGAVTLDAPAGMVLTGVQSAWYGTGQGASCGSFAFTPNCSADVTAQVSALVSAQLRDTPTHLSISVDNTTLGIDPCGGAAKTLRIQAAYAPTGSVLQSPAGGSCLVFDGQDDYVRVGDAPALRMRNTLTLEAWIYPTGNQDGIILNKENEYELARFADGSIRWAFQNASPGWNWVNTGITTPLNAWSHISLTYEMGVVKAYLNGVQAGTAYNGSGPIAYQGGEFWIGARQWGGGFFAGAIDEVRVWNTVHVPTTGPLDTKLPDFVTRNTYSGAGTLLATESTDEGRTEYVYARDGRIRFSQSQLQQQQGRFSYSNYDQVGRVVESGEYRMDPVQAQGIVFDTQRLPLYEAEDAARDAASNEGTSLRPFSGRGYVENLTQAGRYVEFTVQVAHQGPYLLDVRYAAASTGGLTLSINGSSIGGVAFPSTGSWSAWGMKTGAVTLAAGMNTIRLQMNAGDAGYVNLDYLQLRPTQYQAEDGLTNARIGSDASVAPFSGTGYVDMLTVKGSSYATFTVVVPHAATYTFTQRYAAAGNGGSLSVYVNGVDVQQASFPATASWSAWTDQTIALALRAGANTIRYQYDAEDAGYVNLDYLQLQPATAPAPGANSVLALLEDRTPAGGLDVGRCSQRSQVWYDMPFSAGTMPLVASPDPELAGRTQEFVLGAVSKTANGTNTTWYSYDDLGRVTWMVQKTPVGTKTLDYTYDFLGNVLEVAYQKDQPDAFYHHYDYDADKRLSRVYTSPDGTTRTLQAHYVYYLHGPLKRVELADRLQGVDYAYTVQGWLKSINEAQKGLDPGQDSPSGNGVLKDLFGLRLDYFNGDYRSARRTAPALAIPAGLADTHYDGSLRVASWQTPASAQIHASAYQYDAKGQFLQATTGVLQNGDTFTVDAQRPNAYKEGNLSYDAHGNILSLRRYDPAGLATDDFRYDYAAKTNRLAQIRKPDNSVALSYEYDVNGQMTRETDHDAPAGQQEKYLEYDATGKVTRVFRDDNQDVLVATYDYDDRGFRTKKTVFVENSAAVKRVTYYVTDASGHVMSVYEQDVEHNKPLLRTEVPLYGSGRVGTLTRLDDADGTMDARYELNDQLGNARVVFHKPTTRTYLATMHPNRAAQEEAEQNEEQGFDHVSSTRFATPLADDGYVARLNNMTLTGQGPSKLLTVQKGDTVTFSALAYFLGAGGGGRPALTVAPVLAGSLLNAPEPRGLPGGELRPPSVARRAGWLSRLAAGLALTGWNHPRGQRPAVAVAAYLHYQFKDEQGSVTDEQYVALTNLPDEWQKLRLGVRAVQNGTLLVEVSSDDPTHAVYFDNIHVEHTGGLIVQEQHQYAFGAPLPGLSYTIGDKRYRHGYQGQYAEKDEETGYDSFELRLYNSRIGRWTAPDPEGQFDSPYVGMGNNPVSGVDANGGWSGPGPYVPGATGKFRALSQAAFLGTSSGLGRTLANIGISAVSTLNRAQRTIVTQTIESPSWYGGSGQMHMTVKHKDANLMAENTRWFQTVQTNAKDGPATGKISKPYIDNIGNKTRFYYDPGSFVAEKHLNQNGFTNSFDDGPWRPYSYGNVIWSAELTLVEVVGPQMYKPILTIKYGFNFKNNKIVKKRYKFTKPSEKHLELLNNSTQ